MHSHWLLKWLFWALISTATARNRRHNLLIPTTSRTTTTTTPAPSYQLDTYVFDSLLSQDSHSRRYSLESLLLEALEVSGSEICRSPFVKAVLQNNWRDGPPTLQEQMQWEKLNSNCSALPRVEPNVLKGSRNRTPTNTKTPTVTKEDGINFVLLEQPISGRSQTSDAPPDAQTIKAMDKIIKDTSAACKPRKIPIEIPREPGMIVLPSCALMDRCGGCCKHDALTCVPTPEGVTLVDKTVVTMDAKRSKLKKVEIKLEKHNKCQCVCKIKATDCNSEQTYDSKNCRCVCKNKGKPNCNAPQYWDERTCKCRCPEDTITDCSTGSYFSSQLCRCIKAQEIIQEESKRRLVL